MKRIPAEVRKKAEKIRLLLLDVDGVLTDGRIIIDDRGVETKQFDARDGQGISLLNRAGIEVGFVTGRSSTVVRHRAKELKVRLVYQGIKNKADAYTKIKLKLGLGDEQIAYVGDDIADLAILKRVGLAVTVKGSWAELVPVVDYVTAASGGRGAVREIAEMLLTAQGKWTEITTQYHKV